MNIVKKHKIKAVAKSLKEHKSYRKALTENGYTQKTANRGADNKVIQEALNHNRLEFEKIDVTPESVKSNINEVRSLARKKGDLSTMLGADIALGKTIGSFTDRIESKGSLTVTEQTNTQLDEGLESIAKLLSGNRLQN